MQRRVEADLAGLLDQVVSADFPFLGACYGIGALGRHQGGVVDRRFGEPVGAVEITLTPAGRRDPLLGELPAAFEAFIGHKEAVSRLPGHAVLLASSAGCPVQAFRVGANVYATQFHPELDVAGLCTRIEVYKHAGYFEPDQADEIKAQAARCDVTWPPAILRGFVRATASACRPRSGRIVRRRPWSRRCRRLRGGNAGGKKCTWGGLVPRDQSAVRRPSSCVSRARSGSSGKAPS